MNRSIHRTLTALAVTALVAVGGLAAVTLCSLQRFPNGLDIDRGGVVKPTILARDGTRLSVSLENAWNTTDRIPLESIPDFLTRAFIQSEDQHFYEHHGVDWNARWAAAWEDLRHGAAVRGASTITEQVVRMLHPRPRTVWSRWLEGFEARRLESQASKQQILAFYLNQVPYAYRRRGVTQASHYYFNRDLETLTRQEMLALVVLVRSPNGMDLRHNARRANQAIGQLADRLIVAGVLPVSERENIRTTPLELDDDRLPLDASYFVTHVLHHSEATPGGIPERAAEGSVASLATTLDPYIQISTQQILDTALSSLAKRKVHDGGVLVIDHSRNEILAWVVGHAHTRTDSMDPGAGYDTVITPRQPGSTMKPLLYATAIEKGWTAATLINDNELSEAVGGGQHTFHNYSHIHYGPIRLREALGNSLNIPAVRALKFVGTAPFLERLHELGITSLQQHPDFYGDGLALGNGEVSLYEMAQAYTVLARHGSFIPLTAMPRESSAQSSRAVFSAEVTSLIANILSDPDARSLEFGTGLQFPVETAVKTGTSTDYRDAWAIGFDYAHTVAVWMGNLNEVPMDGVTGSVGPAMVLRSVFAQLNRNQDTRGLWLSPKLVAADICRKDGRPADGYCQSVPEWFLPGTAPEAQVEPRAQTVDYRVLEPTPGLQLARDPRIPQDLQAFTMSVAPVPALQDVTWYVDGEAASKTVTGKYTWPLARGTHEMYAVIRSSGPGDPHTTQKVRFYVR
jgi:penicillin-binding protein 1C